MLSKLLTSKAGTLWFQAISFDREKMSDFGGQIIFHYEKCILDVRHQYSKAMYAFSINDPLGSVYSAPG